MVDIVVQQTERGSWEVFHGNQREAIFTRKQNAKDRARSVACDGDDLLVKDRDGNVLNHTAVRM